MNLVTRLVAISIAAECLGSATNNSIRNGWKLWSAATPLPEVAVAFLVDGKVRLPRKAGLSQGNRRTSDGTECRNLTPSNLLGNSMGCVT